MWYELPVLEPGFTEPAAANQLIGLFKLPTKFGKRGAGTHNFFGMKGGGKASVLQKPFYAVFF